MADKIRAEIAQCGAISFARFMELALYCPDCGYYEKENDTIGRRGDFYTGVSVGSLFGKLLAFQFAGWLAELGTGKSEGGATAFQIVEAGAHDGRLAGDILAWLQERRPQLLETIEYWIVEPSARRQQRQKETLQNFAKKVRWFENFRAMADAPSNPETTSHSALRSPQLVDVHGIIFSNELLDSMPVRRLGWDATQRSWFEWGVTVKEGQLVWARLPKTIHDSPFTIHTPPELLAVLPDGFTVEVCPTAEAWWRDAANALHGGKLLTIDYGLNAEEFLTPERKNGTLRGYHRHRLSDDVLADPGEQDITAHVNFTALQSAGEIVGLRTEGIQTQARFLTDIARRAWYDGSGFGPWTANHSRQFQTLTHPEHLGRAFRVLVQAK